MTPRSSAQASMFFALPFVTLVRVCTAMRPTSPCKLRTRRFEHRHRSLRPRRRADPEGQCARDNPQDPRRDEHQVIVPKKVAEETACERRDRGAEHMREE